VLISPSEYDELVYRKLFLDSVSRGLQHERVERKIKRKKSHKEL